MCNMMAQSIIGKLLPFLVVPLGSKRSGFGEAEWGFYGKVHFSSDKC